MSKPNEHADDSYVVVDAFGRQVAVPKGPDEAIGVARVELVAEMPPAQVRQLIELLRGRVLADSDADDLLSRLADGEAVPDVAADLASKMGHGAGATGRQAHEDGRPSAPPRT